MWQRLGAVMRELSADDDAALHRAARRRRQGLRARQRHRRVRDRAHRTSTQGKAYGAILHGALGAIADCRHPTVALIEGICVGGGLEIAALCDIRICGESSRFGVPINKLGLVMAHAELAALVQLAGRATALEMLLEGRVFGAAEALDKRLVNRVVADDRGRGRGLCDGRAASPPARRWSRAGTSSSCASSNRGAPLTQAQRDEGFRCYDSEDFRIGYRAFLAKTDAGVRRPMSAAPSRSADRPAGRPARARAGADHGRPDLRRAARRPGRRRHQGREDARRRRHAALCRAAGQRRVGGVHDDEPQQARRSPST